MVIKKNKFYGSTIYYPPPLSSMLYLMSPLIFYFKNEKLNDAIGNFMYIFVFIACFLLFIISEIVLLIFSFFKIFIFIFQIQASFIQKLILALIWTLVGLIFLFYVLISNDIPNFVRDSFE